MPTAYRLVIDKIEQSRAMVSGEVWHDTKLAALLDLVVERLEQLEIDHQHRAGNTSGNIVTLTETLRRTKQTDPAQRP